MGAALAILGFSIYFGFLLSGGKPIGDIMIIWGYNLMILIAPFLSWSVSMLATIYWGDDFQGMKLLTVMAVILFCSGLFLLLGGLYKKKKQVNISNLQA
ncbi:hypothetical protein GJU40_13035 [Bacillus lacus]|uniref:Uncharacterized protein n=1 Tax=Metabacillus lacus TaxID=1983721 RepID=A0A7X2J098_9BACI|nr:hypothetical protein [Metabacillus lacus]MRX73066.1 hypothetical protein [Metabacillus lacus]